MAPLCTIKRAAAKAIVAPDRTALKMFDMVPPVYNGCKRSGATLRNPRGAATLGQCPLLFRRDSILHKSWSGPPGRGAGGRAVGCADQLHLQLHLWRLDHHGQD